jgi:hypothetical protein
MPGRRASNFLLGKVAIDGTVTTAGAVTVTSGSIAITGFPAAAPFTDASTTIGTSNAALASHAFLYEFAITNTHATQIIYVGDADVSSTRYMRSVYPSETARFPGAGNTSSFRVIGSGASTSYLLGGY